MAQSQTNAQNPNKLSLQTQDNFYDIQAQANAHWDALNVDNGYYIKNGEKTKAAGWKQYKRWEWFWENRVDAQTGDFPNFDRAAFYQDREANNGRNVSGDWKSLGPNSTTGGYAGIGRINVVGFRSGDNNTLYAGSPSGGLWKTTDDGGTWAVLTDDNAVLGVSDVVVIAGGTTATDVVYIGTGDRDGGSMWSLSGGQSNDNNSIGVLKSTDGGSTWSTTGLTYSTSAKETVNRLLVHPSTSTTLYAATSVGVYKTTDGGTTWPSIWTGAEFISMEFKPGDPTIMYGATKGGTIYRSTDSGANWTSITTTGGSRVQLAVSADDATVVYAVANSSTHGLDGIYKSTNSGSSYTKVFDGSVSGNNLLGYECDGTGTDTQGTYDIAIAADPTDANTVYVGGINTWKSTNGGTSWSINSIWSSGNYPTCGVPEVHADKHFLGFQNGTSTLFEGNDGGIYKTTDGGTTWTDKSSNMVISQLYRLGLSKTSSSDVISGLQDNGTKYKSGTTWTDGPGGDGMECAIDHTDANIQYASYVYGTIYRTANKWSSKSTIRTGSSSSSAWVTPYTIDPNTNTTLYVGNKDVYKSTNSGSTWSAISSWGGSTLRSLAVAPSNSNYIYTATQSILYVTTDGGSNWSNITGTLPVGSANITYISVKSDDPLTAWVSFGGYNSHGVYETTDGGTNWTSISTGLPSIPTMCVIQNTQNASDTELYAGTDVGVYVKVGSADWAAYSTGLPNVVVTELEIFYNTTSTNLSRIRAASYGRGLWESELYSPSTAAPITDFEADDTTPIVDQTVNFTDLTINDPTSWLWSFSPATVTYLSGTSSTSDEPVVKFTAAGTYQVSLYTENANGNDTETKATYITVSSSQTYCDGASSNPYGYISRVELGSIDKSSTYTNVGGADPNDLYYEDWTALSTDLAISSSSSITVTNGATNSGLDLGIWIDWNKDGDFEDTNEEILCGIDNGGDGTHTINVPADALLGSTRMRLRTKYYGSSCSSCGTTSNGEVEDYSVNITAAPITWTGSASTDWDTEGNWSGSAVPTSSNNVTIPTSPAGGSVFPVIASGTTDGAVNNLTIESGASVTINGHLSIDGTLTNNAGTSGIVIGSTSSYNGSLITTTDGVSATVNRYLSGGKWHLIGAQVSGATANSLYFSNSPDVWLRSYNENDDTWNNLTDLSTSMPFGMGFATWVETGNNATASFTGSTKAADLTLNSGTTPALAFTDASHGYNLVSNPFTSAIDWDQGGWTLTNIDGTAYVWKDGSNYLTRNSIGQGSLPNGIIPVGQGFFVRTTASSPSLTIPTQARVHSTQEFHGPSGANEEGPPHAVFDLYFEDESDQVWLTFSELCSDSYDEGWDAMKFFGEGYAPQLFVHQNANDLSIAAMGELGDDGKVVALHYEARKFGTHELMFAGQHELDGMDIYLEDTELGHMQDMHLQPAYNFYTDSNNEPERFLLHFSPKITGIDTPADKSSLSIYSWDKAIYIKSVDGSSLQGSQLYVYDLFGRQLTSQEVRQTNMLRVPVSVNNTYVVVKMVQHGNVSVKKVFVR